MMKRFSKKENLGITLIALVITIVVLIILATVVINLSLGQNGVFNKAKIASQEYKNAQDYEQEKIAKYDNEIDQYASLTRGGNISANYSTTEQVVGKWIDGRDVYQITIAPTTAFGNGTHTLEQSFKTNHNIDKIVSINGIDISSSDGNTYPVAVGSNEYITMRNRKFDFLYV